MQSTATHVYTKMLKAHQLQHKTHKAPPKITLLTTPEQIIECTSEKISKNDMTVTTVWYRMHNIYSAGNGQLPNKIETN